MYILKGRNGRNYFFEGPYNNVFEIENANGLYVIICNSLVIKTGLSKNVKKYLNKFAKHNKKETCCSILEFTVKYANRNNYKQLVEIEKEIRKYYNPPLNKFKTKSSSNLKKYGHFIILLLTAFIVLSLILIINCANTPVSVKNTSEMQNKRKVSDVLDSVSYLYFKDSTRQKLNYHNPLPGMDSVNNITHKEIPDSNLIYYPLDTNQLTDNTKKYKSQRKLNSPLVKSVKNKKPVIEGVKLFFFLDIKILSGFCLQLELKKDKTIKPQKPYSPSF